MELKNGELKYSECTMYKLNYSKIAKTYESLDYFNLKETSPEIVPCISGWTYDKTVYKNTVVTEVGVIIP